MRSLLLGCVFATCVLACSNNSAQQPAPGPGAAPEARPIAAASTQADARAAATAADLPLLRTADRAVVAWSAGGTAEKRGQELSALVEALRVTDAQPSGGKQFAQITFYRGETLLREVWVFADGEWGFVRPGTAWTVGASPALGDLVKR
ncbi:hypothetical protein [Polyangium sp. y55x31]|uniref:hypothetical protein n=1 Tax=Polyangium sp. y55x31 TaxID=3042688 RepID=UPI002482C016|nr:hypothetical protein [Polyangium sp. y55x31]MDI1475927.1 hypothetical protein [Polyangium sp. y55x31]